MTAWEAIGAIAAAAVIGWIIGEILCARHHPWSGERLDTEEDLADRERMLDEIEQAHYDRMRAKLFGPAEDEDDEEPECLACGKACGGECDRRYEDARDLRDEGDML